MFIAQVQIGRFRHIENATVGPLPPPGLASEMVVLAGPNGGGKSSILELISYALSNIWGYSYQQNRTFGNASFEVRIGLSDADISTLAAQADIAPARVLEEAYRRRAYYVAFNFPDGHFDREPEINRQLRQLAHNSLNDRVRSVLLRSDRHFVKSSYNRNSYFDWQRRYAPNYLQSLSFNLTEAQYRDQTDFLIELAYNYPRDLGLYHLKLNQGQDAGLPPSNPVTPYINLFQRMFPEYRLSDSGNELRDQLYIVLPNEEEVPFTDLSSGEQEVFFLLTFFLRNSIHDSVVLIDEPELHLHPELARRMIRTMLSINPGNQVWLATHNADLIDEAGSDRSYYVAREGPGKAARVVRAVDENAELALLREIFGYSGFVGLARKLVLLEGDSTSADRRVFASLFPGAADQIRFVPIQSATNIARITRVVEAIVQQQLGHIELFLIRDRDYLSSDEMDRYRAGAKDRVFVLERHEIENYLLDSELITEACRDLLAQPLNVSEVEERLRDVAITVAPTVYRDLVAHRISDLFMPEDASIGAFLSHQQWISRDLVWNEEAMHQVRERFLSRVNEIRSQIEARSAFSDLNAILDVTQDEITEALYSGGWQSLFPGKEVLAQFAGGIGLSRGPALQNAIIRRMASRPVRIPHELTRIVNTILAGAPSSPAE
jgi:ABC-type branched-subunit amino acid transport system ATPase component